MNENPENFTDWESAGNTEPAEDSANKPADPSENWLKQLPIPCVYCGPSMRGISGQFVVYTNGIPQPLQDFIREHPAARSLIVPVKRFPKVRMALETAGSAQQILFRKLLEEIRNKKL